jgi:hypothetical protein
MAKMLLTLSIIDIVIRIAAVVVISTLGMAMLMLGCVMGTDSGTSKSFLISAGVFLVGCAVFALIVLLAVCPALGERCVPGPPLIGAILVRVPIYLCGTAGSYLLLRQIRLVTIPKLRRRRNKRMEQCDGDDSG